MSLVRTKPIAALQGEAAADSGYKRTLGALDLTLLGVGSIIGTGIFVLTGIAAANNAGPAVTLSFVIAGIASGFAALCYAELASMLPISGSAYTYSYATMGELVAWIIGWDLILEYLVGAATVAVGWSGYFTQFLKHFGIDLPAAFVTSPLVWFEHGRTLPDGTISTGQFWYDSGAIVNLPAVLISLLCTVVLVRGIRESARFNAIIVYVKVAVVIAFVVFVAPKVVPANWFPFIPEPVLDPETREPIFGKYGLSGVFQGATTVFFAYIGFDSVSTAAQETKNPQRDLPIGIISSLLVCTVLYVAVCLVLTGVVPYTELNVDHPVALGAQRAGMPWLEIVIEVGAIAGLSSVVLVSLLGQPRIFHSMAKDGLLPGWAAKIHPRYGTPHVTTIVTGTLCAVAAGVLPIDILGELCSIGTLFAFVLVSLGVMILRLQRPDLERTFKVPGGAFLVPILGALSSGLLMYTATTHTLVRLIVWMLIGLVIYFAYGYWNSKLRAAQTT